MRKRFYPLYITHPLPIFINQYSDIMTAFIQTLVNTDTTIVTYLLGKTVDWLLTHGIKVLLIAGVAWLLKALSKRIISRITRVASNSDRINMTEAEIKRMGTIARLFNWTFSTLIVLVSTMMILKEFDVDIAPILAGAGILGVAVGFGGQYLVRDIITGFFIIFENQYRIEDVVSIGGLTGTVEDITLRVTTLRDENGTVHHIPHGEIKTVSNLTKQYSKINIVVGVSYDADINHVRNVVNRVGLELSKEAYWKQLITQAPSFLRVDALDDSAVSIKITGVTLPSKQWEVMGELRKRLKEAFDAEKIEIPFRQLVIRNTNS